MRYALIGCGEGALAHLQAAMDKKLEIAAISDEDYPAMDHLLDKVGLYGCDPCMGGHIGGVFTFVDYKRMIREKKPDVVSVVTGDEETVAFCREQGARVAVKPEEI